MRKNRAIPHDLAMPCRGVPPESQPGCEGIPANGGGHDVFFWKKMEEVLY